MAQAESDNPQKRETIERSVVGRVYRLIDIGELKLGGEVKKATILIVRLNRFDGSGRKSPQDTFDYLNGYFAYAVPPILEHGGEVDHFDPRLTVVARFTDRPDSRPDHRIQAVSAALGIRDALKQWKESLEAQDPRAINSRIVIHSGAVLVGNIGIPQRIDYRAVGETVNYAWNMMGLNLPGVAIYDAILISEELYYPLRDRLTVDPVPGTVLHTLIDLKSKST